MIIYEDTPLGMLVDACTRFPRSCPMRCARTCAALFDRRDRNDEADFHVGDTTVFDLSILAVSRAGSRRGA